MTQKEFLFRWDFVLQFLGLSKSEVCLVIDYPLAKYDMILRRGRKPKKKDLQKWLKKLQLPEYVFWGDIDILSNYMEAKCQNMPGRRKNSCLSVLDWKTGLLVKNSTSRLKPRAMTSMGLYLGGSIGQGNLNTSTQKKAGDE